MEGCKMLNKRECYCCGYKTLDSNSRYDVCPVCFWEDDAVQNANPDYFGGANEMSLNEAKKNFDLFGAVDIHFLSEVRNPYLSEFPTSTTNSSCSS